MNLGYYLNILVCEYLDDEQLCKFYIDAIGDNIVNYEHIYKIYVGSVTNKNIRKIKVENIKKFKDYKFLLYLEFGARFNQKIQQNVFPETLITLIFGDKFSQEIKKNVLHRSLTTLTFGYWFDQEIKEDVLPQSLLNLSFSSHYNKEIKEYVFTTIIDKFDI